MKIPEFCGGKLFDVFCLCLVDVFSKQVFLSKFFFFVHLCLSLFPFNTLGRFADLPDGKDDGKHYNIPERLIKKLRHNQTKKQKQTSTHCRHGDKNLVLIFVNINA